MDGDEANLPNGRYRLSSRSASCSPSGDRWAGSVAGYRLAQFGYRGEVRSPFSLIRSKLEAAQSVGHAAFSNRGRGIHATGYLMATTGRWQWLIMQQSFKRGRGDYSNSVNSYRRDGNFSTLAGRLSILTEILVIDPSIRIRSQSWSW